MMRSAVLKKVVLLYLFWVFCGAPLAAATSTSVVVEIDTIDMSQGQVENVIAEPIEILLGALDDVFIVSAKYRPNKAVIEVKFSLPEGTPVDTEALITRVKSTIDSYMDKLPRRIRSISVSLSEPTEPVIPMPEVDSDVSSNPIKSNRNNNATAEEGSIEPDSKALSDKSDAAIVDKLNTIRKAEKRTMVGRYLGSIESSNEFLPVITTLIPRDPISDNAAMGQYFMSEQDEIVTGKITDCYNNTGMVLTCRWRDKYGTGGVDFIFTPDYSSFNGRWSISGKEGAYKWSGIKVKDQ